MAPIRLLKQSRSNGGKRATMSNLADKVDDLGLDTSPRPPRAAWATPARQRFQLDDESDTDTGFSTRREAHPARQRFQLDDESDTDTGFYPGRQAHPAPTSRSVGPRGPQPAYASSTRAGRDSRPQFRPRVFQERSPPAANNGTRKSPPRFRLSMFKARNPSADIAYAATRDSSPPDEPLPPWRPRDQRPPLATDVLALAANSRALQIERQIIGFLSPTLPPPPPPPPSSAGVPPVPEKFRAKILRAAERGHMRPAVRDYYLDVRRHDVRGIPGQDGEPSLVEEILARDADERLRGRRGGGWRPVRTLGTGGQGKVILWEKMREGGEPIRLATKDMAMTGLFFQDYNSEGHLTRRLNQAGCPNVIKVLEWAYLEPEPMPLHVHDGSLLTLPEEPKFRIAYEVADHGDLYHLVKWYLEHNLVFPEAFIWHMFYGIVNALCYCALGQNGSPERADGWEEIVHADLKPENVLLTDPVEEVTGLYPTAKVADFGLAYAIGNDSVRRYKASFSMGTRGYMAPEIEALYDYHKTRSSERPPHIPPGPHTDIYSLGRSLDTLLTPTQAHYPYETLIAVFEPIQDLPAPPAPAYSLGLPYIYSADLIYWMNRCMSEDPAQRPGIYELFVAVKQKAEESRGVAEQEERDAKARGAQAGVFHAKVLWNKGERTRFETDNTYRAAYRNANLGPLWEKVAAANERALAPPAPRVVVRR